MTKQEWEALLDKHIRVGYLNTVLGRGGKARE